MKNLLFWEYFTDLFFYLEDAKKNFLNKEISDAEEIIEFRSKLRQKINRIQEICEEYHDSKTAYYIIFPIVIYCDEIISSIFIENNISWPKLQKEIFNTEDGGEKIYEMIEQLIEQPIFPEIVYQTNYTILKTEFKGRLVDETNQKTKNFYLKELERLLSVNTKGSNFAKQDIAATPQPNRLKDIIRRFYYIPVLVSIGLFYFITVLFLAT